MNTSLNLPVQPTTLPQSTIDSAVRLMGFDFGPDIFHVLAFDFGDDGGAIGVWREGEKFCARISLDALAQFWAEAKARGVEAAAQPSQGQQPEQASEEQLEAAYWEFDARKKGYNQWKGAPQSERDAFKWTLRKLLAKGA